MVQVHMDEKLAARVDPSDVVQDALIDAAANLATYTQQRPIPFHAWLRQFAWNRLMDIHRRHTAAKRDVRREVEWHLSDASACDLASRFIESGSNPSAHLRRDELIQHVRRVLSNMASYDRQVLIMRHLEGLSTAEIAATVGLSEEAVKKRQVRALLRLQERLSNISGNE